MGASWPLRPSPLTWWRSDTNNASDVFVHDRNTGTTTRVSVDSAGTQANGASDSPALSADGRFVAFILHHHQPGSGGYQQRPRHLRS